MMGPTEVLAQQYASSLGPLLDQSGVSWGLLCASTPREERQRLLALLASGDLCVLFGTHALLESDVVCKSCTLVVIDEEQRFGVGQRDLLRAKGLNPTISRLQRRPFLARLGALRGHDALCAPVRSVAGRTTSVVGFRQRGVAYDAALRHAGGESRRTWFARWLARSVRRSREAFSFSRGIPTLRRAGARSLHRLRLRHARRQPESS
ncbi:MAG: hypothetical protein ACLTQI_07785 [Slackia sp.]